MLKKNRPLTQLKRNSQEAGFNPGLLAANHYI